MYVCMYVCMNVCMYVFMYVCMFFFLEVLLWPFGRCVAGMLPHWLPHLSGALSPESVPHVLLKEVDLHFRIVI